MRQGTEAGSCASLATTFAAWTIARLAEEGIVVGALAFAGVAAYAHQLQHDNPSACFWLKPPVHYTHHKFGMWHHNFGIAVDWWDRLFGTYRVEQWESDAERAWRSRGFLGVRWI